MWCSLESFNMTDDQKNETATPDAPGGAPGKSLPPAAVRALREADERRRKRAAEDAKATRKKEQGGPDGEEPTRYGDWERGGRAIDF